MNNLNIFANSTISGGTYDNIRVFGSASITGDVEVTKMDVYGSSVFKGTSKITKLKVYGSSSFKGETICQEMDIKGSSSFSSKVKVDILKVYGSVKFNEDIQDSKEVSIYGDVNVKSLEADKINIKGNISGCELLNGETIEITTNAGATINEIFGSKITIKPNLTSFFQKTKPVEVNLIEGDNILLENVIAKTVRGSHIKIGDKCEIETLEYRDTVEVSKDSKVNQTTKL